MTAPATAPAHVPACMTAAELALWQAGNGLTTGTKNGRRVYAGRAASPCDDCTLGYAADMRAAGRCDGTPGGVEEDDSMETPVTYASGGTTQHLRTRVTVVAPCASCVHARVCRMRPDDELVVAAELPLLDGALTATLTATVECMEYARATKSAARAATGGGASDQARAWNGGPLQKAPGHAHTPETKERLRRLALERAAAKKAGAAA